MNEADHKRKLVAEINALRGGYAQRWEDRWALGVLDLVLKLPDLPIMFAEGKLIDGHKFGPTPRQWVRGEQIKAAGLKVVLIGWHENDTYVASWCKQADKRTCIRNTDDIGALKEYLYESRRQSA